MRMNGLRTEPNDWGSTFFTSRNHQESEIFDQTFKTQASPRGFYTHRMGLSRSKNPFLQPISDFKLESLKKESELLSRKIKMVKAMDEDNLYEEETELLWDEMSDESENEREYRRKMYELKHIKNTTPKLSTTLY